MGRARCARRGSGCGSGGFRTRFRTTSGGCPKDELMRVPRGLLDVREPAGRSRPPSRSASGCSPASVMGSATPSCSPTTTRCGRTIRARLDVGWMGERVATVDLAPRRCETSCYAARRRGLGAELDVPFSAARRHRERSGARSRPTAARAHAFQSHGVVAIDTAANAGTFSDGEDGSLRLADLDHAARRPAADACTDRPICAAARTSSCTRPATSSASVWTADRRERSPTKCWMYFPGSRRAVLSRHRLQQLLAATTWRTPGSSGR